MSLQLPYGLRVMDDQPADSKYFNNAGTPYTNTAQVLSELAIGVRHPGLPVNVAGVEYWWPSNGGTTDGELVVKTSSGSSNDKRDALVTRRGLTASHTLDATDLVSINAGKELLIEIDSASATNFTIPTNATVAFPVGTVITGIQYGAGLISVVAAGGVTIRNTAGTLDGPGQNIPFTLIKRATNEWWLLNGAPASGGGGGGTWGSITGTLTDQTDLNSALVAKAPIASPTFTGTVGGITKAMVGLGNVDNTADTAKPVSTAQQTALDLKENLSNKVSTIAASATQYPNNNAVLSWWTAVKAAVNTITGGWFFDSAANTSSSYAATFRNFAGDLIARFRGDQSVEFGGTTFNLEPNDAVTSGNSTISFNNNQDIGFRLRDKGGNGYLAFKSSTSGIGKSLILENTWVEDSGLGFQIVNKQYTVVTGNTAAGVTDIATIAVGTNQSLELTVYHAIAHATNGSAQSSSVFKALVKDTSGTLTIDADTIVPRRLVASSGGFSVATSGSNVIVRFTNESGTGRTYTVRVSLSYILQNIPV